MADKAQLILAADHNLADRRITQETVDVFGIETVCGGVTYPIPGCEHRCRRRKNFENINKFGKYSWGREKKPVNARYYHALNVQDAIHAANGRVWIVSGEADVWAMYSAGIHNVVSSGYTEARVEADLDKQLAAWDVRELYLAPDCDDQGMTLAARVISTITNGEAYILTTALALPGEMKSKFDISRAWKEYTKSGQEFERMLMALPKLQIQHANEGVPIVVTPVAQAVSNSGLDRYRSRIACALGVEAYTENGFSAQPVHCPFHNDQLPSASVHFQKGVYCHREGHWYTWKRTANKLGIIVPPTVRSLPVIPPPPSALCLSHEIRQAMVQLGCVRVARLVDALFGVGVLPGSVLTIPEMVEKVTTSGLSRHTVTRACIPYHSENGDVIFCRNSL